MADILGSPGARMRAKRGCNARLFPTLATRIDTRLAAVNIPFFRPPPAAGSLRGRLPRTLAALAAGAGSAALAQPAVPASAVPAEALAKALALSSTVASALAPAGARVVALPGPLDARLALAPCASVEPYLLAGVPAWGRSRVGLRCLDGPVRWNVFLPVNVQVWAPALLAVKALPAGTALQAQQFTVAPADWAATALPPLGPLAAATGRTLARPLLPGQPLRLSDLQPRQWFALGDTVNIVAAGAGFMVAAEGRALSAGLEGQPARVRTQGGRVLVGLPVGEHRIEVGL